MADLMRKNHALSLLHRLRLQSRGCGDLACLLCLEVVGDNGLGLGVALLSLEVLRCTALGLVLFGGFAARGRRI